jgi:glycosyltransferase involved in cell wall biosynthesis
MRLAVFSHKQCWSLENSQSGFATDGGFPFQMRALSEIFDTTTLVVPCLEPVNRAGEMPIEGHNLSIAPLTMPFGRGSMRKFALGFWVLRNSPVIFREVLRADAVHSPIPGDIGTIGFLLAFALRKPLFIRHCGNWLIPSTPAERFWKWFMETFAGGRQVMLATGGSSEPPSRVNSAIHWIFSTTLSDVELRSCKGSDRQVAPDRAKLIIVCRQDREKGTGVVIQSLRQILESFPNASLDVVGDGSSLAEFKCMADDLGVGSRVHFHGKVEHSAVLDLLRKADVFCYPTTASEGFPKVVLEAMACGLPVITTRVSVLPELIGIGGGKLLNKATPFEVAGAVIETLSDRDCYRNMSELAIETAQRFSLERWRDTIAAHLHAAWGELADRELELLQADE